MPKPPFQAAAEGLPTRRQFLRSAIAASAIVVTGVPAHAIEPAGQGDMTVSELQEIVHRWQQLDEEGRILILELARALYDQENARSYADRAAASARIAQLEQKCRELA